MGLITDFRAVCRTTAMGIVPTDSTNLSKETPESLARLLLGYWEVVSNNAGLPVRQIAEQALIAPARCCLKNIGQVGAANDATCPVGGVDLTTEEQLVEKAFSYLTKLSGIIKEELGL